MISKSKRQNSTVNSNYIKIFNVGYRHVSILIADTSSWRNDSYFYSLFSLYYCINKSRLFEDASLHVIKHTVL